MKKVKALLLVAVLFLVLSGCDSAVPQGAAGLTGQDFTGQDFTAQSQTEQMLPEAQAAVSENEEASAKRIAFTFDDGPQAPTGRKGCYPCTLYILDKLEEMGGRATFFVVGERAYSYPEAIRRAVEMGCEVGLHTYSHDTKYTLMTDGEIKADIKRTAKAIACAGVVSSALFRPLGGAIRAEQLDCIASLGYSTVGWSIDTEDYKDRPLAADKFSDNPEKRAKYEAFVDQRVELIVSSAEDGAIILMHDIYLSSLDIFTRAADRLVAEGYELVTISELLGLGEGTPKPVVYLSKNEVFVP